MEHLDSQLRHQIVKQLDDGCLRVGCAEEEVGPLAREWVRHDLLKLLVPPAVGIGRLAIAGHFLHQLVCKCQDMARLEQGIP